MQAIPDLAAFPHFGATASALLSSVGWLGKGIHPSMGAVPKDVFERLCEFVKTPWDQIPPLGTLECPVCVFHPEMTGKRVIIVPGAGTLYVAPDLITHYINAHGYVPPELFCDAVLSCPSPETHSYSDAVMNQGGRELMQVLASKAA